MERSRLSRRKQKYILQRAALGPWRTGRKAAQGRRRRKGEGTGRCWLFGHRLLFGVSDESLRCRCIDCRDGIRHFFVLVGRALARGAELAVIALFVSVAFLSFVAFVTIVALIIVVIVIAVDHFAIRVRCVGTFVVDTLRLKLVYTQDKESWAASHFRPEPPI